MIVGILRDETSMARVRVSLGADDAGERVAADTDPDGKAGLPGIYNVLQRTPDETPARWSRVHLPTATPRRPGPAGGRPTGSGSRPAGGRSGRSGRHGIADRGEPDRTETRLLSAAADQVGQALAQDRLAAEAQAAEIARQSDALKSALLQSVSHDLRTPLATIRAAAGTLRPGSGLSPEDQQESADAIDREVEYLNRLVTNLLDLSRIEAGALRADRDVFELDDLVGQTIGRLRARLGSRPADRRAGRTAGRRRSGAARRGRDQRPGERDQVRAARRGDPGIARRRSPVNRHGSGSPSRTRGRASPTRRCR